MNRANFIIEMNVGYNKKKIKTAARKQYCSVMQAQLLTQLPYIFFTLNKRGNWQKCCYWLIIV